MSRLCIAIAVTVVVSCARSSPPATPTAGASSEGAADPVTDARLAACERDEWPYCWMRALDGSIPGHSTARYRAGCRAGRAADCMRTAIFTRDVEARAALFQRACDGGVTAGCDSLADAWVAQARTRTDPAERTALLARAHARYEEGCAQDDAGACSALAIAYATGDSVDVAPERARTYATRSCALTRSERCPLLADVECALGGPCPAKP